MKSGSWKEVRALLDEVLRNKPPISERRVESVTRLAIKNAKNYKEIGNEIEKFILNGRAEYRLSGLYILHSICKYKGDKKDDYVRFFSKTLDTIIRSVLSEAKDKEKESVKKVVRIWTESETFPKEALIKVSRVLKEELDYVPPGIDLNDNSEDSFTPLVSPFSQSTPNMQSSSNLHPHAQHLMSQNHQIHNPLLQQNPNIYQMQHPLPNINQPHIQPLHQDPIQNINMSNVSKLLANIQNIPFINPGNPNFLPQLIKPSTTVPKKNITPQKVNEETPKPNPIPPTSSLSDSIDIIFDYDDDEIDPERKKEVLRLREEEEARRRLEEERKEQQRLQEEIERVREKQKIQEQLNKIKEEVETQQATSVAQNTDTEHHDNNIHSPPPEKEAPQKQPEGKIFSTTLFVGNLSPSVNEDILMREFEKYGNIKNLIFKKEKHFAFVVFEERLDAERAKAELHEYPLEGRELKIGWGAPFGLRGEINRETGEYLGPLNGTQSVIPGVQVHHSQVSSDNYSDSNKKRKYDRVDYKENFRQDDYDTKRNTNWKRT